MAQATLLLLLLYDAIYDDDDDDDDYAVTHCISLRGSNEPSAPVRTVVQRLSTTSLTCHYHSLSLYQTTRIAGYACRH